MLKTYKEHKNELIFESELTQHLSKEELENVNKLYNFLYESISNKNFDNIDKIIEDCKNNKLNEGLLSGLTGAGVSAAIGPAVMRSICNALGIKEGSALWNLLTSKLVLSAVGYTLFK